MSKKSRTLKKARAVGAAKSVTTVREPSDLVSLIPYLLGYEPRESIVVLSLVGSQRYFGPSLRLDLVELAHTSEFVDYVARLVAHQGWEVVLCVAYSDDRGLVDAVMGPLAGTLRAAGVTVFEALGVGHGRWWSYTCSDPACCPLDGTAFDPTASKAAAAMVANGRSKAASRDALRARFAAIPDDVRLDIGNRCGALLKEQAAADTSERWTSAEVEERVLAGLGEENIGIDTCAGLLAMVQSLETRDIAWMMMTRDDAAQHLALWSQVTRAAPDRLLAPAGSLAGFAAWLSGQGVIASHAADRVSEVAPNYSMMLLLREVLEKCVNPDVWDTASGNPRRVS
jgi:hypothetical protein